MRLNYSSLLIILLRAALAVSVLTLAMLSPQNHEAAASRVSGLPLTTSGIHLAMEFNYWEPTVDGRKTEEAGVDYVVGADGGMHNVPATSGHTWHDKYLSWSRDAAGRGIEHPVSWYRRHHPTWLLYRRDRVTIPRAMGDDIAPLDFTNPAVQRYVMITWVRPALAGGFQGILFDNDLGINYLRAAGHYDSHGAWVSLYTGRLDDPRYAAAQVTAFRAIVAAVHAASPTATVGINQGVDCTADLALSEAGQADADIIMDQQGFTNSANTALPYLAQYANLNCPQGKWLTVVRWAQHLGRDLGKALFFVNPEPYGVSADMTAGNAQARFDLQWALANYLLVKYAHTYFWWGAWAYQAGYPPVMQPEESAAQAIGSPLGDFRSTRDGIYERDFTNGLAVVNPSRRTMRTLFLPPGKYRDLYGNLVAAYLMPPHSGLVLLRALPGQETIGGAGP